jgi:hypothetical protein
MTRALRKGLWVTQRRLRQAYRPTLTANPHVRLVGAEGLEPPTFAL